MKTQQISRHWLCTRCATLNEIYRQPTFKELCITLMSGDTGLVICTHCGQTDQIRFKNSTLELVTG